MTDPQITADVALGWLAGRIAWAAIEGGIIRPFAAAFGDRGYRRLDALTGDRLPDLPTR